MSRLSTDIVPTSVWNELSTVSPGDRGRSIDTSKGRWTLIVMQMGGAGNVDVTATLQDSDDDVTFANAASASSILIPAGTHVIRTFLVEHRAVRRYFAPVLVKDAGSSSRVHIYSITFGGESSAASSATELVA